MDFLNIETREYLKELYTKKFNTQEGDPNEYYIWTDKNVHVWNDMNEPGVFSNTEQTMPKSNRHKISLKDTITGETRETEVEHRLVHSIYGFYNS